MPQPLALGKALRWSLRTSRRSSRIWLSLPLLFVTTCGGSTIADSQWGSTGFPDKLLPLPPWYTAWATDRAARPSRSSGRRLSKNTEACQAPYPKKVRSVLDNRRQDLLNQLEAAATKPVRTDDDLVSPIDAFYSLGFQILYGLPQELQFRAAFHMCERTPQIRSTDNMTRSRCDDVPGLPGGHSKGFEWATGQPSRVF